jgi:hypothetical protein
MCTNIPELGTKCPRKNERMTPCNGIVITRTATAANADIGVVSGYSHAMHLYKNPVLLLLTKPANPHLFLGDPSTISFQNNFAIPQAGLY